ncbi:MAG: hypothetical protein JWO94_360 [Verrucomicrobiaceae bacterium]|nr:hypothetical protein [Verrucomicrobiaceae bacterium]
MSRDLLPEDDFSFLPRVDDAEVADREALRAPVPPERQAPVSPIDLPPSSAPPAPTPRIRLKVKPVSRPPAQPEQTIPVEEAQHVAAAEEPKSKSLAQPVGRLSSVAIMAGDVMSAKGEGTSKNDHPVLTLPPLEGKDKPEAQEGYHTVVRPPGAAEKHKEQEPLLTPKEKMRKYWLMIGGQSLALSVILHLSLLVVAALIVIHNVAEQHVDFLPGGGTSQGDAAEKSLAETVKQKRTPWMKQNPLQRVASSSLVSDIRLPETPMDAVSIPDITRKMDSMGFGSAGAGGGFGSGIGTGGKSGVTFQPIMMFGKNINAKRMAVILDVSSSMTDYLSDVVKEVDRVAKGSPVICYFGCGLMRPEKGGHVDDKVDLCKNPSFERFWRIWYGPSPFNATPEEIRKLKFDPKSRIPLEEVYRPLAKRPGTYFVDYNGIVYAWTALVNDLVRNADALYWFSDFMDDVEDKEIKIVLENLKRRKQRLYIQPSIHGSSFEQVLNGLVIPTGGEVIEPPPK